MKKEIIYVSVIIIAAMAMFVVIFAAFGDIEPVKVANEEAAQKQHLTPIPLSAEAIELVDKNGKVTLRIVAGPPAVLEAKDSKGRVKQVDLSKLIDKLSFWGEE